LIIYKDIMSCSPKNIWQNEQLPAVIPRLNEWYLSYLTLFQLHRLTIHILHGLDLQKFGFTVNFGISSNLQSPKIYMVWNEPSKCDATNPGNPMCIKSSSSSQSAVACIYIRPDSMLHKTLPTGTHLFPCAFMVTSHSVLFCPSFRPISCKHSTSSTSPSAKKYSKGLF